MQRLLSCRPTCKNRLSVRLWCKALVQGSCGRWSCKTPPCARISWKGPMQAVVQGRATGTLLVQGPRAKLEALIGSSEDVLTRGVCKILVQESFLLKVFPWAPCTRSLCKALVQSSHTNLILTQRYHTGEPLVKSLSLCKGSSLCTTSLCMVLVQGLSSREILVQSDPSSCKVLSRGSCTRSSCKADVNARPSCKAPVALVHGPCARLILMQYPCAKWLILVYGPCGKQLILVQGLHLRLLCKDLVEGSSLCKDLMKGSPLCKVRVQGSSSCKVPA